MRPGQSFVDQRWLGYDPRAAAPTAAAAAGLSATILVGRWAVEDLSALADRIGAFLFYLTVLAVWPTVLGVATYRAVFRAYRVTDRAVLIDWGPLSRPEPPVWLARLADVRWGLRWLGVGWVELTTTGGRTMRLRGVLDPKAVAELVRRLATKAADPPPG